MRVPWPFDDVRLWRAAGALTALATQAVESARIDQQAAQQITNSLTDILNSYEMGHATDAQHKLADLSQKITTLESQGQIGSPAAAPFNAALANMSSALGMAAAATQPPDGN